MMCRGGSGSQPLAGRGEPGGAALTGEGGESVGPVDCGGEVDGVTVGERVKQLDTPRVGADAGGDVNRVSRSCPARMRAKMSSRSMSSASPRSAWRVARAVTSSRSRLRHTLTCSKRRLSGMPWVVLPVFAWLTGAGRRIAEGRRVRLSRRQRCPENFREARARLLDHQREL